MRILDKISRLAAITLLPALLLAPTPRAIAKNAEPACISRGFPHETSDLTPDPSLIFGRLDNGLRYVLKKNGEPKNRVALYLNVQAGSLHESEAQRGLAHFLEHMLFNGSTHYPPGTLVRYFQSIGMDFGADSNAHTGYDETVYKLVLPAADEKTLADGLLVLADYARGAMLPEAEVERERGVIFSEKRSRNSAASRARKAQLAFDFAGTLVAERDPIGTDETLTAADAALLRSFYDAWYRPGNMIVVMVGDMDVKLAERLLRRHFAGLTAAETAPVCPDYGRPAGKELAALRVAEPELGYTEISLATVAEAPPGPDSLARETDMIHRYLAQVLLNNRLEQLEREPGSPISKSMTYSGEFIRQFRYSLLSTRAEAADWERGLRLLHATLEQALRRGFTESELARGKKEVQAMLEKAAQTEQSRDSRELAMTIIKNLNDNEVTLSPGQEKALFGPIVEKASLETVNNALRAQWPAEPRTVVVAGTALDGVDDAEERIRAAYAASAAALAADLPEWQERESRAFPYLAPPEHEPVAAETKEHAAIGAWTLRFANGLVAHIKKTDFQPNQTLLSAHFGFGLQSEPAPGASLLAPHLVRESGTGTLNRDQLQEALAGSTAALEFFVGPESFSFNGSCLNSELELLLQLLYARLHDPGFRPEAFAQAREQLGQMYAQMGASVEGVQQLEGERFLSGGSRFYAMPTRAQVEALTLARIADWLRPVFATAPLEISIVGDVDPDRARVLLERYFGGDKRTIGARPSEKPVTFPAGRSLRLTAPDSSGKAKLTLAWKTDDFWDIDRTRGLNMLAAVLDDRVRIKIREELGAAYSPKAYSLPSRIDAGFGLLESRLVVAPEQAETVAKTLREVAAKLAREGASEEEFKRAQEPTLTAIREQMRHNAYWLNTVLALSERHPEQLEWPVSIERDFAAMTAERISALAEKYLRPERAAEVLVMPEK